MQRRILIAVPSGSGAPDYTMNLSIDRAKMECAERGWQVDLMYRVHDSMITRARDVLFSSFYAEPAYTDMFFWDDDVACRPGCFARLMEHPVDLVGGAYRGRCDAEQYVIRAPENGFLQFDPDNKLMQVEAIATGFMRMTRKVAEAMVNADPDAWYMDGTAPKDLKIYSIFDNHFDRATHQKWSEDYYFCRKWRELGGKVWVDPLLELDHTGKKVFTGCLFDYLKRGQAAQPQAAGPNVVPLVGAATTAAARVLQEMHTGKPSGALSNGAAA